LLVTLYIDTAVRPLYLALEAGTEGNVYEHVGVDVRASDTFHVGLEKMLSDANVALADVTDVILVRGPGSFTGLRVAYSVIEAMMLVQPCLNVQSVTALEALLLSHIDEVRDRFGESERVMVMTNAHGGQVFTQEFSWHGEGYKASGEIEAQVLADMAFAADVPLVLGEGVFLPVGTQAPFISVVGIKRTGMAGAVKSPEYSPLYIKPLTYRKLGAG